MSCLLQDISQAMTADLPILSSMLSRLFESSQFLDDVGLHHLVDALCRLSIEDMENASNNKVFASNILINLLQIKICIFLCVQLLLVNFLLS